MVPPVWCMHYLQTFNHKQTMANNKKVDALGFDRFQIASVRRAFQSNALTYKKMDGIAAKIKELGAQYDALEAQTQAWEAPAKQISKEVLGIELNSRQILAAHENPEAFFAEHPELKPAAEQPEDVNEGGPAEGVKEAPAEEAAPEAPAAETPESPDPFGA